MLGGKIQQTFQFNTAKELRDFLNGFTERELDTMYIEDSESNSLRLHYIDNDLEDGSHTYDLRVAEPIPGWSGKEYSGYSHACGYRD